MPSARDEIDRETDTDLTVGWPPLRAGLRAVRRALGSGLHTPTDAALRAVASEPYFADVLPGRDEVTRGNAIVTAVTDAVYQLRGTVPPQAAAGRAGAPQRAIVLWSLYLVERVPFVDLVEASSDLFEQPLQARYPDQQVKSLMWWGGARISRGAAPGIRALISQIDTRLHQPERTLLGDLDDVPADDQRAADQLIELLALQAPEPLPFELLTAGRGALPAPLRGLAVDDEQWARIARIAEQRGEVVVTGRAVRAVAAVRERAQAGLHGRDGAAAAHAATRFWREALPPDTHFHQAWRRWRVALPHVMAVVGHAETSTGRALEDAAYLLDRASVFLRQDAGDDEAARELAERAVAASDRVGQPDPVQHGIYLGNLALALQHLHRYSDAADTMRQALTVKADTSGTEDAEYAGSLNVYGNILKRWKRYGQAEQTHAEALAIMRRLVDRDGMEASAATFREVLNDYASDLLARPPLTGPAAAARAHQAQGLLHEALAVTPAGSYGYDPIIFNLAVAHRRQGDLAGAAALLGEHVSYCETTVGDPSFALFAALAELAEVLAELGDPQAADILERARAVDEAL